MVADRCIYCGSIIEYSAEETAVKCIKCGQEMLKTEFRTERDKLEQTEAALRETQEALAAAEAEKAQADQRLFHTLEDLGCLKEGQQDTLSQLLRAMTQGQESTDGKLLALQNVSEKILQGQSSIFEIIGSIKDLQISMEEKAQLAQDFLQWSQTAHEEDTARLEGLKSSVGAILEVQEKARKNLVELQSKADETLKTLNAFQAEYHEDKITFRENLFKQAEDYQLDRKFEQAEETYRRVIVAGEHSAEIYWRVLLCHYGVQYRLSDKDNQYIPTILQPDLTDPNEMSDRKNLFAQCKTEEEKQHYARKLALIDKILDKYRFLRSETKYDVFISVKQKDGESYTADSDKASDLYDKLKGWGFQVFNSRRTPPPAGELYEPYIISAIISSRVMIVVGTKKEYMNAGWVRDEWTRFSWLKKQEEITAVQSRRHLFCYLANGMRPKDIPDGLNPNKQAVIEGPGVESVLRENLKSAFPEKFSVPNPPSPVSAVIPAPQEKESLETVLSKMDVLLAINEFDQVREMCKQSVSRKEMEFSTSVRLPLYALCAQLQIGFIEDLPKINLDLSRTAQFRVAQKRAKNNPQMEEWLKQLVNENQQYNHAELTVKQPPAESPKATRESNSKNLTVKQAPAESPKATRESNSKNLTAKQAPADPPKEASAAQSKAAKNKQNAKETDRKSSQQKATQEKKSVRPHEVEIPKSLVTQKSVMEIQREKAIAYREKALEGDTEAQYQYALCLLYGRGVAPNESEYKKWLTLAAQKGHGQAKSRIEKLNLFNSISIEEERMEKNRKDKLSSLKAEEERKKSEKEFVSIQEQIIEKAEKHNEADYEFILNGDGTVTITKLKEVSEHINIPKSIQGKMVTCIWRNCVSYDSKKKIKSVDISDGVVFIGIEAFSGCENLTKVSIPNSMRYIEGGAFAYCKNLTDIIISDSHTAFCLENGVLFNTTKQQLILYPAGKPDTVYSIPAGVTQIERYAFSCSSHLTDISIPDSITSIGKGSFTHCENLSSIQIPKGVKIIEEFTFSDCKWLTNVTIPNSVTSINSHSFSDCENLVKLSIPNSVTIIDSKAFNGCKKLQSVNIPDSVNNIGWGAFGNCLLLERIQISEQHKVFYTENGILYHKQKKSLICYPAGKPDSSFSIPKNIVDIELNAFEGCVHLKNVTIPDSITEIGCYSFDHCSSLVNISIPNSVTAIRENAFSMCEKLSVLKLPESITIIKSGAFLRCNSLKQLSIPISVTRIESFTFAGCSGLKVVIPDSVTFISDDAFYMCEELTLYGTPGSFAEKYAQGKGMQFYNKIVFYNKEEWERRGLCPYCGGQFNFLKKCKSCGRKK